VSAARHLLDELADLGATLEPAGERLILRAGRAAIPAALVRRVREAKSDLLAELMPALASPVIQPPGAISSEQRIVQFLNEHPCPSSPGMCAWCGRAESPSAVVLPFGTEPGTHTWLHAECWRAWHEARRDEARRALQVEVE
jgi:hypothetical protein